MHPYPNRSGSPPFPCSRDGETEASKITYQRDCTDKARFQKGPTDAPPSLAHRDLPFLNRQAHLPGAAGGAD